MTDKQTIIDDLDTRCPHHCSDTIGQCLNISIDTPSPWCIYNKDCIYKQYALKEQENKDLREDIKDIANLLDLDTGEEYNFGNLELEIKQLKAKEQECEQHKRELEHAKGLLTVANKLNQALLNEREKLKKENETLFKAIEEVNKINKKLETENEILENDKANLAVIAETLKVQLKQLKQTLAEIKPILEYYANSTIGYKTKDGIYRIELSYKYGYSNSCGEPCYYEYNPKPAKEALRKINEVE